MSGSGVGGSGVGVDRALAAIAGESPDVTDILAHLVADCATSSGASAVAVLALAEPWEGLDLLAATSHRSVEMALWSAQHSIGPSVEAMQQSRVVSLSAAAAGSLGRLMTAAGFAEVTAYPVRWRGEALAGLNLCWSTPEEAPEAEGEVPRSESGQVYADLVALAIAHPALADARAVRAALRRTLAARAVVEQAKGALAYVEGIDVGTAYERLLAITAASGSTLSEVAAEVVRRRGVSPSD